MNLDLDAIHAAAARLLAGWAASNLHPGGLFDPRSLTEVLPSVLRSFDDPDNSTAQDVLLEIGEGDFDEVLCAALVLREAAGSPAPPLLSGPIEVDSLLFVHGDLHVAGDLANRGMVVVTGDLVVQGCFWDADVGNQLVVLGHTRLGRLNLYGGARLAGDLWVDELLYGVDHCDTLQVAGDVRATLVILEDTELVATRLTARLVLDPGNVDAEIQEASGATVDWLVPEVLSEDGIDVDSVLRRLEEGATIWRTPLDV